MRPSFKGGWGNSSSVLAPREAGTYFAGIGTPYRDSLLVVVDSSGNSGALSNYANYLYLNNVTFRKAGNSATEFSKVLSATGTTNPAFYFVKKSNYAYVPHFVEKWDTTNGSKIAFKFSNADATRDTVVLFYNNSAAPDCSHLETTFPVGDDFNGSSITNLCRVDSARGVFQLRSRPELRATKTAGNLNCRLTRATNLIYYPNDANGRYYKAFSGATATTTTNTDSAQIAYFYASTRDQVPYTLFATAVITNKANSAGCDDPYAILKYGVSSATDSVYLVYFNDSTLTANDGIWFQASQASNCTTWTAKTAILQNATNVIRKPVLYFEGGTYVLFYEFQGLVLNRTWIGCATASNPRGTYTVLSNTWFAPNFGATGASAWDSTRIAPVAFMKNVLGVGDYWMAYEGRASSGQGTGGLLYSSITGIGDPANSTYSRFVPSPLANSGIARPLFTFFDSAGTWTGRGGFDFQPGADSGSYRFDFIKPIVDGLNSNYLAQGRGVQLPSGATNDTVRGIYLVKDSVGFRRLSALTSSDHPTSLIESGGGLIYNYSTTNNFEVVSKFKIEDWRIGGSGNNLINFTFAVGDTPLCADSVGTLFTTGLNYVKSNNREGIQWNRTMLTGSNFFQIYDSSGAVGAFQMGRSGFITAGDTNNANLDFRRRHTLSPTAIVDAQSIYAYRFPAVTGDSMITLTINENPIAQTYDNYDTARRNRTKTSLLWAFDEKSNGQGGQGLMDWWYYHAIQSNYREPLTFTIKTGYSLGVQQIVTVGQGTYDSSYVRDNCIVFWGGANTNRYYNEGAGLASANNTSLGYVSSTGIDESRLLIWFSEAMIPYNAVLDSAVIDLYMGGTGNYAGTDADGIIAQAFDVLKDWTEGTKTSMGAGSQATMSSATRRGSGTGVGGTTIASTDTNWFTQVSSDFASTNKEVFAHNWGISAIDTFKCATGSDGTHKQINVTAITLKHQITRVNYGYLIRDVSAKPSANNMYCRPGAREESTAAQRPTITYYYKLAS